MKIYNFEQWTEEWFNIRKFKMTASNAQTISVNWKWLETYIYNLVAESFSKGERMNYTNEHMKRWNELEEFARELYELETWNKVKQVWFIELSEYIWCSPDWLIWEEWWLEIKCLMDSKHFWHILWLEELDKWHLAQIQMCMYVTWRQWWDYVLFNPNYDKSLIIHRINRDEDFIFKLKQWLIIWEQKIKDLINKYNKLW